MKDGKTKSEKGQVHMQVTMFRATFLGPARQGWGLPQNSQCPAPRPSLLEEQVDVEMYSFTPLHVSRLSSKGLFFSFFFLK